MGELLAKIILLCSLVIIAMFHGVDKSYLPEAADKWFEGLGQRKEKVTTLHFYLHDTVSGKNPSAVEVARASITSRSHTLFGSIYVLDDLLTTGPEPNSTVVGRAQGIYASAGLDEFGLLMTLNYVFASGTYNGSTLSVLGRNPFLQFYREMSIVGGSGVFRLARGIATSKTYWLNTTSFDCIVEYNVIVLHY